MNARTRHTLFALVFVAVGLYASLAIGLPRALASRGGEPLVAAVVVAALVVAGVGLRLGLRGPSPRVPVVDGGDLPGAGPRVTAGRASTRATVLVVLACLSFTATVLPFAVHLPRWVEVEIVLGAWWLTWAVVLAVLAYRGRPLDETRRLEIRAPFASSPHGASKVSLPAVGPARSRWAALDLGSPDGDGCIVILAAAVLVGGALVAAWVVVELAAPAVFFLAYLGIARALRRALAASHRGDALRSGLHGALWATAYVAPLGVVIAIVHALLAPR